ncbi:iron complex transport system substrate-binding protein [Halarchaeum solikamskense]|uniref:ABC transporter substrate-binding protein n=1 Tax=Halarchaeum nitratireducens TaxID=489913 RepID=UPI001B3A9ABF|nr:ABC transporter substrate-binding protein [Halarchaeum solikamskense]MBP2251086.1 iron complex transport system substrate-binding protein [Halarchaeum solikamskense]
MNDDTTRYEAPTRRDYLTYGGAVAGGGLLAGCSGQSDSESTPTTDTPTDSTNTTTTGDESYSVTMSPAGTVEFEKPPESVFTDLTHHAGMALAVGRADAVNATWGGETATQIWNSYLERIDGVSIEWSDLPNSFNPDKELLYELGSDLHLADPAYMTWMDSLDRADITEIRENVAPWFGNTFSNTHGSPPEEWADVYEYYTLWEIFERVAKVFQSVDRYRALADIHASVLASIERNRPPEDDRPTAVTLKVVDESLWVYPLNAPGFTYAHTRPLGATDVFPDLSRSRQIDYETLIEHDPDVILVAETMGQSGIENVRTMFEEDPVGQRLSAVTNDRVCAGGIRNQGPVINLFQLEMTAKQLYPDAFGEWPTYTEGPYPEIPESEQLFDRDEVANIINGDL